MMVLSASARSLEDTLGLALPLLALAERDQLPWITASVVSGPAVVLGAAQRAGRVVDLQACAAAGVSLLRRSTAGTAVYIGRRAIVWTLALPHVASIVEDATPRTLLNRNVRGFLKGLSRRGVLAHYFGREWVSANRRPVAVLGFEATPSGATVIEYIAGVDAPPSLPPSLCTEEERSIDRWLGKVPVSLGEIFDDEPLAIAQRVMDAMTKQATSCVDAPAVEANSAKQITRDDDPIPPGFLPCPARRAPIGWIDTGVMRSTGRRWIGGDVIVPAYVLRAISEGITDVGNTPIEGASMNDLVEALQPPDAST
jgi:hypothetical protein